MILVGDFGQLPPVANGSDSGEYVFTSPLVKDFDRFALSQPHRQGSDNALMRYVNPAGVWGLQQSYTGRQWRYQSSNLTRG